MAMKLEMRRAESIYFNRYLRSNGESSIVAQVVGISVIEFCIVSVYHFITNSSKKKNMLHLIQCDAQVFVSYYQTTEINLLNLLSLLGYVVIVI